MIQVKVKQLSDTATLPTYGSEKAAAADLYADLIGTFGCHEIIVHPNETVKIGTGLSFQPPKGYCALILARSGLSTKQGLAPANKVGLCDEDYTGEYIVALHNHGENCPTIKHGDRIAQVLFIPYIQANFSMVRELDTTNRGDKGFGSTGIK